MKFKLMYLLAKDLKLLILIINVGFFVFGLVLFNSALAADDYSMVSTVSAAPKSPYILKLKKTINCVLRTDIQSFSDTPSRDINHGSDTSFVGVVDEHVLKGPESFCIDSKRNLYICDTVNKRIIIFDGNGNSSGSIDLDYAPNDITTDDFGNLYIYHDSVSTNKLLLQYDKNKDLIGRVDFRLPGNLPIGSIRVASNKIYIECGDEQDLMIGVIENGVLKPSSNLNSAPIKGIVGLSGKRYFINVTRNEKTDIDIYGINPKVEPIKVSISFKGVLSANFLGEDESGNFYIQTESHIGKGNPIALDVIKCNSFGKVLDVLTVSSERYRLETIKLLTINNHGDVFQFAPSEKKAYINVYSDPAIH
ncbi:MAG TPA: hypothetical protein VK791_10100 [bacterium]|nr:hypothetical protein [bacterium]